MGEFVMYLLQLIIGLVLAGVTGVTLHSRFGAQQMAYRDTWQDRARLHFKAMFG